jgi:uncharacterized Zn-binding protein involved in type VI secretion
MSSVAVNPPKTPVTEGSSGKAFATTPNVCKMPGPPAPFVPTPLPNLGTSGDSLKDGTTDVTIEGKKVAIKGATFMSQPSGDVASQGTGGGLISAQVQGKTEFLAPGSMDVKFEGKNVQLLGDAMGNNGGSPVNAATMKELQDAIGVPEAQALCDAVCKHAGKGKGRGQSARAEEEFLKNQSAGWERQESFPLGTKTPTGRASMCRPDLVNSATNKIVELKLMPGEDFTPNQKTFQDELKKGKQPPHTSKDFITVTPATCGC